MQHRLSDLTPRERQIAALLLEGCENAEIAKRLRMNRRTVKAYFQRFFERYDIKDGIKRVKLATLLYREQLLAEQRAAAQGLQTPGKYHGHWGGKQMAPAGVLPVPKPGAARVGSVIPN